MKPAIFLLLILLAAPALLKAQDDVETRQDLEKSKALINTAGLMVGAGPAFYSLDKLNKKLTELDAPTLHEGAGTTEIKVSAGMDVFMASIYLAYANLRQQDQPSSFTLSNKRFNVANITALYYGFDISSQLFNKHNFQVNFPVIGFNQSYIQVKLDSVDTRSGNVTTSQLSTSPSSLIILKNNESKNVRFSADLFYVFDFKSNWNLKMGLTSGYNLPVKNNEWVIVNRNNTVVSDMPKIDKGNFYALFSLGVSVKFGELKNS